MAEESCPANTEREDDIGCEGSTDLQAIGAFGDLFQSIDRDRLLHYPIIQGTVPGRSGILAVPGPQGLCTN